MRNRKTTEPSEEQLAEGRRLQAEHQNGVYRERLPAGSGSAGCHSRMGLGYDQFSLILQRWFQRCQGPDLEGLCILRRRTFIAIDSHRLHQIWGGLLTTKKTKYTKRGDGNQDAIFPTEAFQLSLRSILSHAKRAEGNRRSRPKQGANRHTLRLFSPLDWRFIIVLSIRCWAAVNGTLSSSHTVRSRFGV
jgi:hypothetical protein